MDKWYNVRVSVEFIALAIDKEEAKINASKMVYEAMTAKWGWAQITGVKVIAEREAEKLSR